jgi:hypothetical protein
MLNDILELADITGIVVIHQHGFRVFSDAEDVLFLPGRILLDERAD